VNFSWAKHVKPTMEAVAEAGVAMIGEALERQDLANADLVTFRVTVRRRDKSLDMNSMELAKEISGHVLPEFPNFKVKLKNPDVTLFVDWGKDKSFVYANKVNAVGGLPVGSSGKVVSLLSAGFDSPVASWMMMRRGATVVFVHFHSYPAVGHESVENVEEIVKILNRYQFESKLYLIPLIDYQKAVVAKTPAPLRVLLYRRMMIRLAERVRRFERAKALVTGESLGQVASQTLDNMNVVNRLAAWPVMRPLIGMNKREIIQMSERVGTAEISAQPYEDCCSLYVPKAPALAAKLDEIEAAEALLDVERFEDELWEKRERKKFP